MKEQESFLRNKLFNENIDFALNIYNRFVNKYNYQLVYDNDDLYQASLIGLFEATKRYQEAKGDFQAFASFYIIGCIKDEMRKKNLIKISRRTLQIIKCLYNNDSLFNIKQKLDCSIEDIAIALQYKDFIISLDKDNSGIHLGNISDSNSLLPKCFELLKNELNPKMYQIFVYKYIYNYSQKQIGSILGCSQTKISRLLKKGILIIKDKIS